MRADRERVPAVHLDHDRPFFELAHPENSDLRLIDDREAVDDFPRVPDWKG